MTLLASKVDTPAQRLDKMGTPSSALVYAICETYGVQGHTSVECYNGSSTIDHANALHSFDPPPHHNSDSTTYNQGWKSHPNPLYKSPNSYP